MPRLVSWRSVGLVLLLLQPGCYDRLVPPRRYLLIDAPASLRGATITLDGKAVGRLYPPFKDNALFALFDRIANGPEPDYARDQHRITLTLPLGPLLHSRATHSITIHSRGTTLDHAFQIDPSSHVGTIGIAVVDGGIAEWANDEHGNELYLYDQCRSERRSKKKDRRLTRGGPTPNPSLQRTNPR